MPRGFRHPAACRSVRERTPIVNHVEISVHSGDAGSPAGLRPLSNRQSSAERRPNLEV